MFCGTAVPEELSKELVQSSAAATNFQIGLAACLSKWYKVHMISYLGFSVKDRNKLDVFFTRNNYSYVIKQDGKINSFFSYYKKLRKMSKENAIILTYNLNYITLFLPLWAKLFGKQAYLLLADHTESKEHNRISMKIFAMISERAFKKFNGVITLSTLLGNKLSNSKKNVLVLEGGINFSDFDEILRPKRNKKLVVLYSGLLSKITGVDQLILAIEKIKDPDLEFRFTGRGELINDICLLAERDHRVKFIGFLDRKDYINQLEQANILVNPRNMQLPQNLNNFPSKIIEYLASGRVIISTRFAGYEKFEDNIIFSDNNYENIADAIMKIVKSYGEIYESSFNKNRQLAQQYDWSKQAEKVVNFVKKTELK